MRNYLDFAENDYQYFQSSYDAGIIANAMAVDAQEICEKYMKHIIDTYCVCNSAEEQTEMILIMRTHNLIKLYRFIENSINYCFSEQLKQFLNSINGYYFTARYPGDESIEVTHDDLEICNTAVMKCREEILSIVNDLENQKREKSAGMPQKLDI